MKRMLLHLFLIVFITPSLAQNISGDWTGILKAGGSQLELIFHVEKTADGYSATMDSPSQGVTDLPVTSTTFTDSVVTLIIANAGIEYSGTLGKDGKQITGNFKQSGHSFPMNLSNEVSKKKKLSRPQEPKGPFPYVSEEVQFQNVEEEITLTGNFSYPNEGTHFPAVVLISGSGPQNRDSEVFGHKPFLVLSDHLNRNGIAVLRFDERGVGASEGDFSAATTYDFATDVEAALEYLHNRKEVDQNIIGLIGHSEGGIIAPMVSVGNKEVDFLVLLAPSALGGDELLLLQKRKMEELGGVNESAVAKNQEIFKGAYNIITTSTKELPEMKEEVKTYFNREFQNSLPEKQLEALVNQITTPWMLEFLKLDPITALEKVQVPVLALYGEKDFQVPPKENIEKLEQAFEKGRNEELTVMEMENLNHLFQESTTGLSSEYGQIEQTFSPIVLEIISNWILEKRH